MTKTIPQLTAATLPVDLTSLMEISIPGGGSRKLPLSAISPGAVSDYAQQFVYFDGTAYLKRSTSLLVTNSQVGTTSFWYNDYGRNPSTKYILGNDSWINGLGFGIAIGFQQGSGGIQVAASINSTIDDTNIIAAAAVPGNLWVPGQPNHVLASWDATGLALFGVAINGRVILDGVSARATNKIIDYTASDDSGNPGFLAGSADLSDQTIGALADVFLDTQNAIVNSKNSIAQADVRKFIDFYGNPMNPGADGSGYLGAQPALFFTGNAAAFPTNKGYGGAFVLTGSLTDV